MIVTREFYLNDYKGQTIPEAEFDRLNQRAEDDIQMKSNKPLDETLSIFLNWVRKAICSQIEYYFLNGDGYNDDSVQGESLGKYSYSGARGGSQNILSPRAKNYLNMTDLVYRGLDCESYT